MDLHAIDVAKAKEDMKTELNRYREAAVKKRGRELYVSLYCNESNNIELSVLNAGLGDNKLDYGNPVLATVHYPPAAPGYGFAFNTTQRAIVDALHWAELRAWKNFNDIESDLVEHPSREMKHPSYATQGNFNYRYVLPKTTRHFRDVSLYDVIQFLTEVEERIAKADKEVISSKANLFLFVGNTIFVDSFDTDITQEISRVILRLYANAKADDLPFRRYEMMDSLGAFGGFELFDKDNKDSIHEEVMKAAENIAQKTVIFAKATDNFERLGLDSGTYDAVFDSRPGTTYLHEELGHMVEATSLLEGTISDSFRNKFRQVVNNRTTLNIIDYLSEVVLNGKRIIPASFYMFDAEGTKADKTYIIKDGRFNSLLTTRITAGTLKKNEATTALTGNARVEDLVMEAEDNENDETMYEPNRPESRMSTTWIEPSTEPCSLDELLEGVNGKGFYVGRLSGYFGEQVGYTGQGNVIMEELYFVDNDENLIPIRPKGYKVRLIDDVFDLLGKIDAVADETTIGLDVGICMGDNGDLIVSSGGAAFRVRGAKFNLEQVKEPVRAPLISVPRRD